MFDWEYVDLSRPCAQVKELRVNIRSQSCVGCVCSLVESDEEKREDGVSEATGGLWWEARRDPSASCTSAKMQLPKSPALAILALLSHLAF